MKKIITILAMTVSLNAVNATTLHVDPGAWRTKICAFHGVRYAAITGFEAYLVCPLANSALINQTQVIGHEHRDDVHNEECYSSRYQD